LEQLANNNGSTQFRSSVILLGILSNLCRRPRLTGNTTLEKEGFSSLEASHAQLTQNYG